MSAVLAGVGFGLIPALVSTRLKAGPSPRARSHHRLGFRNLFVAYQVAASLMLLLVTGYLVVGYQRSAGFDAGYQTAGLYLFALDPIRDGYSADESVVILNALPRRLSELGSVRAATLSRRAPLADFLIRPSTRVWVPTGDDAGTVTMFPVAEERVGAGYFATLGLPIVRGRLDGSASTTARRAPRVSCAVSRRKRNGPGAAISCRSDPVVVPAWKCRQQGDRL